MDCSSLLTGSRQCYLGFRYYYAFGNTPARDFLEYAHSEWEHPLILVLGCGDIRSCFYTLWKNFNPRFEKRFKGVSFTLNDRSSAVMARNILFLYLCVKLPTESTRQQKWLMAMWSIWFCHELLPEHERVLKNALKELLQYSENWSSGKNPLHSFVEFNSPTTLAEIKLVWSLWYSNKVVESVEVLATLRNKELSLKMQRSNQGEASAGLLDLCGSIGLQLKTFEETAVNEYKNYLDRGSAFAESLFSVVIKETVINPTFFEEKNMYNVHYGSCPFRCFQQVYSCSIQKMAKAGMHVSLTELPVNITSQAFERYPLLANSFQQFSIWISFVATILSGSKFIIDCSDVFEFSRESNKQYDLVFASNVIDSTAPPAFILASIKLIKESGYFICASLIHPIVAPTLEKYLESTFGFPPKFLPVICGIRCINQEGEGYSSSISPDHIPVDVADANISLSSMREKILTWQKINKATLILYSLSDCPDISKALSKCFFICCTPLLKNLEGMAVLNFLCTNTAIKVLELFSSRFNSTISRSHVFWSRLCLDLKNTKLDSFLLPIQTQALISGIHLHLTVDNFSCPICTGTSLSDCLRQISIQIPIEHVSDATPVFVAYVSESSLGRNVEAIITDSKAHIFNCSVYVSPKSQILELSFLTLMNSITSKAKLSLIQYTQAVIKGGQKLMTVNYREVLLVGNLCDYIKPVSLISNLHVEVFPNEHLKKATSSLGKVTKHCGNGDYFESIISLAEDKPEMLTEKIRVKQRSLQKVEVACADHIEIFEYPYPIDYNRLSLQRSKKAKTLTIKAFRMPYKYEKEGQLFYVNPEDPFSFPVVELNVKEIQQLMFKQFTVPDWKLLKLDPDAFSSSLLKVKRVIRLLFELNDEFFFELALPSPGMEVLGMIEVVRRVIDVHRKILAVDVKYCFIDDVSKDEYQLIRQQLKQRSMYSAYEAIELFLYKEAYALLNSIFSNFSHKTLQVTSESHSVSRSSLIRECGIETYFKRAMVYPLYQDPERACDEAKCAYCKQVKPSNVQKCSRCQKVSYCSKQCQRYHWSEHKLSCNNADTSSVSISCSALQTKSHQQKQDDKISSVKAHSSNQTSDHDTLTVPCNYCKKLTKPRRCMRCLKVSYCGPECQRAHWKQHRNNCKPEK